MEEMHPLELFLMIGEREVRIRQLEKEVARYKQEAEDGRLELARINDSIRDRSLGPKGEGCGRGVVVPIRPDESSSGDDQVRKNPEQIPGVPHITLSELV